jgi:ubiquinone/menaquinone biosynthesis C-methylase UbiE
MEKSVNFNRAADFYDATRGFPEGVDKQIAAFIQKEAHLTSSMKVLELGIGTGRIALPLAPHVDFIAGADISADMLHVLLRKRREESVFPVEADGHYLPYDSHAFDAVVVVHVLHLVPEPLRVLDEIARTLKPEGRLLHCFTNHEAENPSPLMEAWNKSRRQKAYDQRWDKTQALLKSSSWLLENELSYGYTIHETPQHYFDMIAKRAWSSTWDLSDEELEIGLNAMRKVLEEEYGGNLSAPIERRQAYQMQVLRPPA